MSIGDCNTGGKTKSNTQQPDAEGAEVPQKFAEKTKERFLDVLLRLLRNFCVLCVRLFGLKLRA
jgi:hypothetical protein